MGENNVMQLKAFFGVTGAEFRDFWGSLTEAEKDEYKAADLS